MQVVFKYLGFNTSFVKQCKLFRIKRNYLNTKNEELILVEQIKVN